MNHKRDLVDCVRGLYAAGLTSSVSGNHSIRSRDWMWITPSGVPRYAMRYSDMVRVNIHTGRITGNRKPSVESGMHREIYSACPHVNAIVHTHSPYTIALSISSEFVHVIEEAQVVVGMPLIIPNAPSGSKVLAKSVADGFRTGARAVIVKNHGVVAAGIDIHDARAIIESLEEWSKILTLARMIGGPRETLSD